MLAVLLVVTALTAQDPPIRVYLAEVVSQDGFVDEALKRRLDSRADLLLKLRRERSITLTDDPEQADLLLSVTSSAIEKTDQQSSTSTRNPLTGQILTSTSGGLKRVVRVELEAGPYKTTLATRGDWLQWTEAAQDVANQVRRWVQDNRAQLLTRRPVQQ